MQKLLNNNRAKSQRAISLIEMLLTIVIFTVMAGALYGAFLTTNKTWSVFENNTALGRELRGVYSNLTRELREAKGVFVTAKDKMTTVSFTRPKKGIVTYTWSPQGPNANKIIRQDESETKILADHVTSFVVVRLPRAVSFEIVMTKKPKMGSEASVRLKGKVDLRL